MEAKSTDRKTMQLIENEQVLATLIYENSFMFKAKITIVNSDSYEVKQVGFWGTSIIVTKDDIEIASLKMNWSSQIIFTYQDGQEYILKTKGTFNSIYILENKEQEKLIQLHPKFSWSKFDYSYEIFYDKKSKDLLLIMLGIYAANYSIAVMSGAM